MISLAPVTKLYLASKPVSMRLGFDGLAALVRPLFLVEPPAGIGPRGCDQAPRAVHSLAS